MQDSTNLPSSLDPSAAARQLIQQAHNQDGLPEIAIGLTFLLVSGLIGAQTVLPKGSFAAKAVIVTFAFLLPVLGFCTPSAIRWVRNRFLLARVGYVQPKPAGRQQIALGFALALLVTAALFGVVTGALRPDAWLIAGTGVLGGALAAFSGRLPRFVIYGVVMAAVGIAIALASVPIETGFTIYFGLTGLMVLVSGCVVLLKLIRQPLEAGD